MQFSCLTFSNACTTEKVAKQHAIRRQLYNMIFEDEGRFLMRCLRVSVCIICVVVMLRFRMLLHGDKT